MNRTLWYKLDGHTPVPATGVVEAMRCHQHVACDEKDGIKVSTVFLGMDHRILGDGAPLLFETMIFGGHHDQWQDRCSTWEEAEAMHRRALEVAHKVD